MRATSLAVVFIRKNAESCSSNDVRTLLYCALQKKYKQKYALSLLPATFPFVLSLYLLLQTNGFPFSFARTEKRRKKEKIITVVKMNEVTCMS